MSIYKDCDIRGIYGIDIYDATAYEIGRAIGTMAADKNIVVAGDYRLHTPILQENLIRGLSGSGANVLDIGQMSTPEFYFYKSRLNYGTGVMVTASHNPPEYNGFKIMLGNLPVVPEDIKQIELLVKGKNYSEGQGLVRQLRFKNEYVNSILNAFPNVHNSYKVVVDAGNGAFSETAPKLFHALGFEVVELFCRIDGSFPGRDPNPAVFSHIEKLCNLVPACGAQLGLAFDGDGDRVVFVDEKGTPLLAEEALVIFMQSAFEKTPSSVVYDIKCSSIVKAEAEKLGARALMERSGHAFIKRRLLETKSALAGEVSGHFFFHEIGGDDGLYAAIRMADILYRSGKTVREHLKDIRYPAITPDIRLQMDEQSIQALFGAFETWAKRYAVDRTDGLRLEKADGSWSLLRRSVTECGVTLRFEAPDESLLNELLKESVGVIPMLRGLHPLFS